MRHAEVDAAIASLGRSPAALPLAELLAAVDSAFTAKLQEEPRALDDLLVRAVAQGMERAAKALEAKSAEPASKLLIRDLKTSVAETFLRRAFHAALRGALPGLVADVAVGLQQLTSSIFKDAPRGSDLNLSRFEFCSEVTGSALGKAAADLSPGFVTAAESFLDHYFLATKGWVSTNYAGAFTEEAGSIKINEQFGAPVRRALLTCACEALLLDDGGLAALLSQGELASTLLQGDVDRSRELLKESAAHAERRAALNTEKMSLIEADQALNTI